MEYSIIRFDNEIAHIALSGKLNHEGAQAIEAQLIPAVATLQTNIIVDISEVTYLTSLGIKLLMNVAKILNERDLKLALLKPQPLSEDALMLVKLDQVFLIGHDEAEMLEKLGVTPA